VPWPDNADFLRRAKEKVGERAAKHPALDGCRRALFVQSEPAGGFGVVPYSLIFSITVLR
jgi:hypothetical protein